MDLSTLGSLYPRSLQLQHNACLLGRLAWSSFHMSLYYQRRASLHGSEERHMAECRRHSTKHSARCQGPLRFQMF
jgi:hypothetical protein